MKKINSPLKNNSDPAHIILAKDIPGKGLGLTKVEPVPQEHLKIFAITAKREGYHIMFVFNQDPELEDVQRYSETSAISLMPHMVQLWVLEDEF